ncbi:MAG: hypothetical protein OXN88_14130 [Chloroflexota bacterium]|nr:hypothetical protein [Chloroflexota bacterium]
MEKTTEQSKCNKLDLPLDPKTGKPYTPEGIAKVLLNTKPKELKDWREKNKSNAM